MNRPEIDLARAFAETRQRAAPDASDRARISELLRAQLGASVVDGAAAGERSLAAPPPTPVPVRPVRAGWSALGGTGAVMGALGFLLGYGMGVGDRGALPPSDTPSAVAAPSAAATLAPSPSAALQSAPVLEAQLEPAAPPSVASPRNERPARIARERPPALAASDRFGEVVEKLRSAQRALGDGRASLALLQVEELERFAGDTLREERDVTRVLALCALADVAAARRAATGLLAAGANTIYAHRLEQSCVGAEPLAVPRSNVTRP